MEWTWADFPLRDLQKTAADYLAELAPSFSGGPFWWAERDGRGGLSLHSPHLADSVDVDSTERMVKLGLHCLLRPHLGEGEQPDPGSDLGAFLETSTSRHEALCLDYEPRVATLYLRVAGPGRTGFRVEPDQSRCHRIGEIGELLDRLANHLRGAYPGPATAAMTQPNEVKTGSRRGRRAYCITGLTPDETYRRCERIRELHDDKKLTFAEIAPQFTIRGQEPSESQVRTWYRWRIEGKVRAPLVED